jgi:hypothetical protein
MSILTAGGRVGSLGRVCSLEDGVGDGDCPVSGDGSALGASSARVAGSSLVPSIRSMIASSMGSSRPRPSPEARSSSARRVIDPGSSSPDVSVTFADRHRTGSTSQPCSTSRDGSTAIRMMTLDALRGTPGRSMSTVAPSRTTTVFSTLLGVGAMNAAATCDSG